MSSGGVLSGIPTTVGTFVFSVNAAPVVGAAPAGPSVSATYQLTVINPLKITSSVIMPNGVAGLNYSQVITASGGTQPYTFTLEPATIVPNVLPAGLSLNAGGLLSGIPTTPGNYGFTIDVTDTDQQYVKHVLFTRRRPGFFHHLRVAASDRQPAGRLYPGDYGDRRQPAVYFHHHRTAPAGPPIADERFLQRLPHLRRDVHVYGASYRQFRILGEQTVPAVDCGGGTAAPGFSAAAFVFSRRGRRRSRAAKPCDHGAQQRRG